MIKRLEISPEWQYWYFEILSQIKFDELQSPSIRVILFFPTILLLILLFRNFVHFICIFGEIEVENFR